MEQEVLASFKPIFNRGRGILDPCSPHARNAALLPFLIHVYVCESGHLQILTSDFHANTWHARLSYERLKELKGKLEIREGFSAFLQGFHEALSSDEVKVELGGPASAVGGKGATSAKLKGLFNATGISKELILPLEYFKGRNANDAIGALALDLYDAFSAAQNQISELEANVKEEKQRSANVLNAVLQGKADAIHFRPSTLPNVVHNEVQASWSDDSSPTILMPTESPVPSVSLNSYLSPFIASSMAPGYSVYLPVRNLAPGAKPYKSSASAVHKKRGSSHNSALKLSEENSYSRTLKKSAKVAESIMVGDVTDNAVLPASEIYESRGCSEGSELYPLGMEKRKYRELNDDLLSKIESGGENRSAKTDAWARRHYAEWRKSSGLPEREIEELTLLEFAESLVRFFCMVKKHNGDLFPSESLKAMYRGFVRIIQSHHKKLAMQGSYNGPIVDAGKDLLFEKARLSCVEAMKHSLLQGASQSKRSKADEVLPILSDNVLAHAENQVNTPQGLCRRLCYYAIHKFGINGNMELYDTTDMEFRRIVNEQGDAIWEYDEKRAEKYKSKGSFRSVVQCGDSDLVECLDKYFMHLPPKPLEDEPRRLFLAPIRRPTTNVWFRHQNISSRTLLEWYRYMRPVIIEQVHEPKQLISNSLCLLRCGQGCDEKDPHSDTNLNLPATDTRGERGKKITENETFGKVPDAPSDTDDDSTEHRAGEHDDLTDLDPHE